MPDSMDKRHRGMIAVAVIVAIVVAIFAGCNLWYLSGNTEDDRPPATRRR
jgi:hypothetical protein